MQDFVLNCAYNNNRTVRCETTVKCTFCEGYSKCCIIFCYLEAKRISYLHQNEADQFTSTNAKMAYKISVTELSPVYLFLQFAVYNAFI